MFRIVVEQVTYVPEGNDELTTELYRQSVEVCDLQKIIAAVNAKPRKAREPRTKKAAS